MIAYRIDCDCGEGEAFARVADLRPREDCGSDVQCNECGTWCRVLLAPTRTIGIVSSEYCDQLDMEFTSERQKKAWLADNGMVEMDRDSRLYTRSVERWKDLGRTPVERRFEKGPGRIKSVSFT